MLATFLSFFKAEMIYTYPRSKLLMKTIMALVLNTVVNYCYNGLPLHHIQRANLLPHQFSGTYEQIMLLQKTALLYTHTHTFAVILGQVDSTLCPNLL
jgi:hypothetical protein